MTQHPAPGQQLLADAAPLTPGSPLTVADSVATSIIDEIGASAHLVSANVEAKSSAAASSDESVTAEAVVTAVLSGRGTSVLTEVSACVNHGGADNAVLRLVFSSEAGSESSAVSGLLCPASKEWNADLHARLSADEDFTRLIETYDGTIGLSIGGRPVHIRCYRGQILEVVARSVKGADFVLNIPGEVFIDLMTSQDNSFMETAMLGRMKSSGSGYEYLRMTSALIRIVDHARALAEAAGYSGTPTHTVNNLQEV